MASRIEKRIQYGIKQFNNSYHFKTEISALLTPTMDVLDFGSGMGGKACWVSQYVNSVTGFEIDKYYLTVANRVKKKTERGNVKFVKFNILKQKNTFQKFDIIMLNDVIEHLPKNDLLLILSTLKKYLKVDGKIYIQYPPWAGPWSAHTNHILPYVPWIQYLPAKLRNYLILKKQHNLIGGRESTALEVYQGLNHLTPSRLKKLLNCIGYTITYRKSCGKLPIPIFTTVERLVLTA